MTRLRGPGWRLAVIRGLLVLLVLDSVLYPDPFGVPAGLLHPEIAGVSFRPYEVVIALGLLLAAIAGPWRRPRLPLVLWAAFAAWLLALGGVGLLRDHPLDLVAFEAKAIVYLAALAIACGVPPEAWRDDRWLPRLVGVAAAVSAGLLVTSLGDWQLGLAAPGLRKASVGAMGTDTATVFAALGVVAVAVGLGRRRARVAPFLVAAPLLLAPLAAEQRAAVAGAIASLAVLGVAWLLPTGRRRFAALPRRGAAALVAVTALAIAVPFGGSLATVVSSKGKSMSAEGRRNQWREAAPLMARRPVAGHGLGTRYRYYEPGKYRAVSTDLTHNVVGDLVLRTGAVGALLFLAALGLTLREGLRGWRERADSATAVLALAATAVVVGLLAKGMVESILEKFRLATLLGLALGAALSLRVGSPKPDAGGAGGTEERA